MNLSRNILAVLALGLVPALALAGLPSDPKEQARLIGQPTSLEVKPATVNLDGPRAGQQLVVTGKYADGTVRDLTAFATYTNETPDLLETTGGFIRGKRNANTQLTVQVGGQTVKVPVAATKFDQPRPVSFRQDVIAGLNVGGCNAGACHGTPSGKNGFRLSLRGFDPALDFIQLTRDVWGRRTDKQDALASLLLQKALGRVPHEGGARFGLDTVAAQAIAAWISEGMRDDPPTAPTVLKAEVLPGARVLNSPARWQQLAVVAHLSDNSTRDVTRLTVFSSSDPAVADVSPNGLVEFKQAGEVAILCRYLEEMNSVRLTYLEPRPGFVWSNPPETNYVDKHVFAKLKLMTIQPSDLCTDPEYVRRAYLDLCGLLPTPEESTAFVADKAADKRAKLIDTLLNRAEYADFWALKWSDVLRSNRKTIQVKGVEAFQLWLRDCLSRNEPIDTMIRELLTANGSTYANPPANYYRIAKEPTSLAETTAQLFFGVRMQCAKCHNHPFEAITQDDYYSTAAWFARVKTKKESNAPPKNPNDVGAEVVYSVRDGDVTQPRSLKTMAPKFLKGAAPTIPPGTDRREVFAEWVTGPTNPYFARSIVNRVWYHLMGKGIVDPVDDFRESNPPSNDELLDALAKDFVAKKFDMKALIRTVMTSRSYQLSATPNDTNKDDAKYFSHTVTKLLSAEQLLDALCDVTAVPEKFPGLPMGTRAIQLPDGEVNHPFLKTFGQPARELACECERESDSNLAQALQLINGPTINDKLRNPNNRLGKLLAEKKGEKEILDALYLAALARPATDAERAPALSHVAKGADKRKAWEDVLWAILNTREFLFRH
ncbi:MAG TPA: DUF1549 and DUF1553 domain-containing protein [Gemmataceae bacterium]|jgi:hypothetical protein|nr:DUF1549 and DUF1553 domain-containing protein [Gemmataceae bacterium]